MQYCIFVTVSRQLSVYHIDNDELTKYIALKISCNPSQKSCQDLHLIPRFAHSYIEANPCYVQGKLKSCAGPPQKVTSQSIRRVSGRRRGLSDHELLDSAIIGDD